MEDPARKVALAAVLFLASCGGESPQAVAPAQAAPASGPRLELDEGVQGFRRIYLGGTPESLLTTAAIEDGPVFGVIGEYAFPEFYALALGLADGRSRLLTAGRSGQIGPSLLGGEVPQDESTEAAARAVVRAANECLHLFARDDSEWLPEIGFVRITLLVPEGHLVLRVPLEGVESSRPSPELVKDLRGLLSALTERTQRNARSSSEQPAASETGD